MIRCVRLWSGVDGNSHFEEGVIDLGPRGDTLSGKFPIASVSFQETNADPKFGWHPDPARQLVIGDFRLKLQVEAQFLACLMRFGIEEVNDVSPKKIFEAAAFVKVEGADGIHFDCRIFAQDGAKLALEIERPLPHLRHGEGYDPIRHRLSCTQQV